MGQKLHKLPASPHAIHAVRDYVRNAAMDTAPDAGILVMGQQSGDGILVYKYDSERQKLERVWVAD